MSQIIDISARRENISQRLTGPFHHISVGPKAWSGDRTVTQGLMTHWSRTGGAPFPCTYHPSTWRFLKSMALS